MRIFSILFLFGCRQGSVQLDDSKISSEDSSGDAPDSYEPSEPSDPVQPDQIDDDGDGYTEEEGDCDDTDDSVYPGASDIPNDDIDQDCNGTDFIILSQLDLTYGDLRVSEIQTHPKSPISAAIDSVWCNPHGDLMCVVLSVSKLLVLRAKLHVLFCGAQHGN